MKALYFLTVYICESAVVNKEQKREVVLRCVFLTAISDIDYILKGLISRTHYSTTCVLSLLIVLYYILKDHCSKDGCTKVIVSVNSCDLLISIILCSSSASYIIIQIFTLKMEELKLAHMVSECLTLTSNLLIINSIINFSHKGIW